MSFLVEKLSIQEVDSFWHVFKDVLSKDFPGYSNEVVNYFLTKLYNRASFHYWLNSNFKTVLVAKENDKIIGFAVLDKPYGGVCFCRWLGVLRKHRRQGVGRQLIETFIDYAKSYGCHKVELASQPEAKKFYERCSLKLEGKRDLSYFGIDQFIFGKVIGYPADKIMTKD